jgi:MATE family multidrug resistance protein
MLKLALPVVMTYLGLMLMGVVDLIFVGHVNPVAIGAVGVGTSIFNWVMIFGTGLLMGLDYLVSFAQGAKRPEDGFHALMQGLIAVTAISIPCTALMIYFSGHLDWLSIAEGVRGDAAGYLSVVALSLWPSLVFTACRQYLTANESTWPPLLVLLAANVLNAAMNYALVFGHWGAPALGARGSAWATVASRLLMMITMFVGLWAWDRKRQGFFQTLPVFKVHPAMMRAFLRLGLPSALHMTFEVGVFALSTTLAARLAAEELAAHQIALNIASLTFMVPLGVSSATAVRVGQRLGDGRRSEAAREGWRGIALGVGFMLFSGLVLLSFRAPILGVFTNDARVLDIAYRIILIVALFQLSDGAQVVGAGALRGWGDTRSSMLANLVGHWFVGFPLGITLCFFAGWGLPGLWVGLATGLTAVAAILMAVWRLKSRPQVVRSLNPGSSKSLTF